MTLPPSDDFLDGNCGWAGEEFAVRATVNGTTVVAFYQVEDATVMLTSADFGNASAALEGMAPEAVATRLLQEMTEVAMARSDVPYLRDDETRPRRS